MPVYKFNAEPHTYTIDGIIVPSITGVLPYNYFTKSEYAMGKGSIIHKMVHLHNLNDLDEDALDRQLVPYLDGYRLFEEKEGVEGIVDVKSGVPHPCTELQLAGQKFLVDEGVDLNGNPVTDLPVFEIPLFHPTYRFGGTPDIVTGKDRVYALYLQDNGKYKLEDHTKELRRSLSVFLSKITSYKWDKEKGLL